MQGAGCLWFLIALSLPCNWLLFSIYEFLLLLLFFNLLIESLLF